MYGDGKIQRGNGIRYYFQVKKWVRAKSIAGELLTTQNISTKKKKWIQER